MEKFRVIESHAQAIIQCQCGEFISLTTDRPVEACGAECPFRYNLSVRIVAIRDEPETELIVA